MNTELFEGTPEKLKDRLDALIAGAATTIDQVLKVTGGTWLIIWS